MQAINKGLNKLEQEFIASESDGPVSEVFCKVCCWLSIIKKFDISSIYSIKTRVLCFKFFFLMMTDIEGVHSHC